MTKEKAQTVLDCLRIMIPILEEAVGFEYKTPRCKDCKYWADGTCEMLGTVHMTADDFCSRGEKR